ncbi:hypothetical protein [Thermoflavifilum thermophilum]|uniref:Ribosome-associated translation inhibitor RaiA n=1 Tax=Thermoflavifilum thermophilum TaxID=1393122 RepID=A0A1I7N1B4_9BACT|nr:hypothetical protein [Thermoflavifilum thermophilum]SFV28433.1 Ribosome-associated translation inhibitor RaiA [Thermoflavifilum thermophilum]
MKYHIQNLHLVQPPQQQTFFEEEIQKKLKRIERILKEYPKLPTLAVHIKKEGAEYVITLTLPMLSKVLLVKDRGTSAVLTVNNALDTLRKAVREQKRVERKDYLFKRKQQLEQRTQQGRQILSQLHQESDAENFIHYLDQILPDLRQHVMREAFRKPLLRMLIKENKLKINDILNDLYISIYDAYGQLKEAPEKLNLWVYEIADRKLQEISERYKQEFGVERDWMPAAETAESEELTANAEEMPELVEDLDDVSYHMKQYAWDEILMDAGLSDEEIEQFETEEAEQTMKQWLREQDSYALSVFEMHYLERYAVAEIAHIKGKQEAEIEQLLQDMRTRLINYLKEKILS